MKTGTLKSVMYQYAVLSTVSNSQQELRQRIRCSDQAMGWPIWGSILGRRKRFVCLISAFRRYVNFLFCLARSYAAQISSQLPKFRDKISVPSSMVRQSKRKSSIPRRNSSWAAWLLNMGPIGYPKTPVTNYQSTLRNIFNSEDLKIFSLFHNVEVSSGVHSAPNSIVTIFSPQSYSERDVKGQLTGP